MDIVDRARALRKNRDRDFEAYSIELPKGYYVVVRVKRSTGLDEAQALAKVRALHPGKIVGAQRHSMEAWGWQVQTQPLPTQVRG